MFCSLFNCLPVRFNYFRGNFLTWFLSFCLLVMRSDADANLTWLLYNQIQNSPRKDE